MEWDEMSSSAAVFFVLIWVYTVLGLDRRTGSIGDLPYTCILHYQVHYSSSDSQ